jgi:hypothetical protein
MSEVPLAAYRPVRRFAWRTGQRHRPGLQFVASTGRHHGFESMAELRLLLALDFVGAQQILAQPFRLRFQADGDWLEHVPDFVAVLPAGTWLLDVRPDGRIRTSDGAEKEAFQPACGPPHPPHSVSREEADRQVSDRATTYGRHRPHQSLKFLVLGSRRYQVAR